MIRGEKLSLQVLVFNYMDQDVHNVNVRLTQSDDFLVEQDAGIMEKMISDESREVSLLASQSVATVQFIVTPVSVGQLKLDVRASSSLAGDGEVKFLKVKSEGIEQFNAQSLFISLAQGSSPVEKIFTANLPIDLIKDSEKCSIQIIGLSF